MKLRLFFCGLSILCFCGCAQFRALFDETPEETKTRQERQKSRKAASRSALPVQFGNRKEKHEILPDSELTPAERRALENSLAESASGDELKLYRDQMRKRSEKNSEFVFGKGFAD